MPLSLVSEGAAVLASSHTSVLINHCSAQLRMHTRATTFLGQVLLSGGGPGDCGIGTASNDMRATWHTGPRLQVHTHNRHTQQARVSRRGRQSRGPQQKTVNKVSVLYLAVWVSKWSKRGTRNLSGSLLMLLLMSWLPLSSFFCCYFHILENMK